jgi:hypothetical protein
MESVRNECSFTAFDAVDPGPEWWREAQLGSPFVPIKLGNKAETTIGYKRKESPWVAEV